MTTHMHDDDAPEAPLNASQDTLSDDHTASIIDVMCDADGPPYELTTHYLMYGPVLPNEVDQAHYRANFRDDFRSRTIIDYRLI